MKSRMQNLRQEFLKKWMKGLQIYKSFKKDMTILERKRAIKLCADVAIASTRSESTHWSRALVADISTDNFSNASKTIVEEILGRKVENKSSLMITCSNKILRRTRLARHKKSRKAVRPIIKARLIAKKLVKNRTRVLKRLVPGGQQMDEISLIKETLDYVSSLRVQVDVMRRIAAVAERLDPLERLF